MLTQEQKQDYFNRAVEGLAKQGFTRSQHRRQCLYRSPNGKKCALGHLIPDDRYSESLEGRGVSHALLVDVGFGELSLEDEEFFNNLQTCHDGAYTVTFDGAQIMETDVPSLMVERLRVFGENNDLTLPEVLAEASSES